ncbi:MAG: GntR family transcriptional regulator [Coprobacillaceae bacterium]
MTWNFENDRPIYLQIMDELIIKIVSGEYEPGQKIPPVRELATQIKVNPNTLQRAFSELESLNIIKAQRTSGRFVTNDTSLIAHLKNKLALQKVENFFDEMRQLGFNNIKTLEYINSLRKDDK